MSVFSPVFGVSAESETCFQPQFLQVIAVLDLSSLLLTYYIGKKRTLCIHTLFLLSKLQLWPVLLRLERDKNGSRDSNFALVEMRFSAILELKKVYREACVVF